MSGQRFLSLIVVADGESGEPRTFRISYRRLRILAVVASVLGLALLVMAGSWWYLAARALRATELAEALSRAQVENRQVVELGARLEEVEARYATLRSLFGSDTAGLRPALGLPPASGAPAPAVDSALTPTSWPLSVRGFVTRPLLAGASGDHPGIDIAVPEDSYVRAAGAGEVVDAGENDVYGRYVLLDHANGYRTRYAHASRLFVEAGQRVRRHEVIALSGSTGRSTAPHLHFETVLRGGAVDPLSLVRQP